MIINGLLRRATMDDMNLLFEWINEEETRNNSLSPDKVIFSNHKEWFLKKLKDNNSVIYIYEEEKPIGQIRIDIDKDIATISYSIDKNFRGQGYGTKIIELLELQIKEYKTLSGLRAVVKNSNIGSLKIFRKLNYLEQVNGDLHVFTKEL